MGQTWVLVFAASAWLVALSTFDIRYRRLPDMLTLPGAAVILAGAAVAGHGGAAVVGAAALFAAYLSVHLVAPAAMGAGDVKLAVGVGALTGAFGPDVWVVAALGASLLTATWAGALVGRRTEATVPHGFSMCASTAAVIFPVIA